MKTSYFGNPKVVLGLIAVFLKKPGFLKENMRSLERTF